MNWVSSIALCTFANIANQFFVNGTQIYFYYDIFLFILLLAGISLAAKEIWKNLKPAGERYILALLIVAASFIIVELVFVRPTTLLFNDEYVYMSVAKSILIDHSASICSFSLEPHCVAGTSALPQQPTGWPFLMSIAFGLFGIGFATGYNLALVISVFSIFLVFYISYILIGNARTSLLSSLLFAAIPLFMTFSRSILPDTPELTMVLLSIALLLTYLKDRKPVVGFATVAAVTYALIIKVDAVIIVPILLSIVAMRIKWRLEIPRVSGRRTLKIFLVVAAIAVIVFPQIVFVYNSWTKNTFGAGIGQKKFQLQNFEINFPVNIAFWAGEYGSILFRPMLFGYPYYDFNIEWPTFYTVFGLLGLAFMILQRQYKTAALLCLWFATIFVFYTAYYAGGALFTRGNDVRYFLVAFPVLPIFAAFGIVELSTLVGNLTRSRKRRKKIATLAFAFLVTVVLLDPAFEFARVVTRPPQKIHLYSGLRFDEQMALNSYNAIPAGCFVLTYEPPLWNVLNVSNMYAGWFLVPTYRSEVINFSHGCLYLEYGTWCQINGIGCHKILQMLNVSPIVVASYRDSDFYYNGSGLDYNYTIYKINGYKNGTALYKRS